jgi:cell division protein ZapA
MVEQKAKATVDIYGEDYIMRGDATPEYMRMLANYIDKKMKNIAARQPQLSVTKIAVLAALNIADELSKLQEDYDALIKMMDSGTKDEKKNEKKNEKKQA